MSVSTSLKTIYIVEDDVAAATMIREALELEGDTTWCVQVFNDGAEAINAIKHCPPDLLLLDLRLPGADGSTIFRRLRSSPATLNMPVLFITGATHYDLHDKGIDEGVLLRKPVNLGTLLHVVRAHLHAA
jgi:DNA-binding response OmpR family regulator